GVRPSALSHSAGRPPASVWAQAAWSRWRVMAVTTARRETILVIASHSLGRVSSQSGAGVPDRPDHYAGAGRLRDFVVEVHKKPAVGPSRNARVGALAYGARLCTFELT